MTVENLIAKFEKDQEMKAALDNARAYYAQIKMEIGEEAFRKWLLSHFVNVENIGRDV
mgnify:CR=1 FL=1